MLLEEAPGRAEPVGVGLSWLCGAAGFCVLEGLLPLPQPDPSRELEGFSSCYPWDLIGGRAKRNDKSRAGEGWVLVPPEEDRGPHALEGGRSWIHLWMGPSIRCL